MAQNKISGDDVALYLFHQGNNMKAYEYMGAHRVKGEKDLVTLQLNGNGPLGALENEKACEITWGMRESIIMEGCKPDDINTNLLKNAE